MTRSKRSIGRLFPDPNLALTVLEAMRAEGIAPAFDAVSFAAAKGYQRDDHEADLKARAELLKATLSERGAERLTELYWDGGNGVHHDVWTYWDGEDETFDVRVLEGVSALTNLHSLVFTGGWGVLDASPLQELSSLREVTIEGGFVDVAALEPISSLKRISLSYVQNVETAANSTAIEKLRARGVEVEVMAGADRSAPTLVGSHLLVLAAIEGDTGKAKRLLKVGAPADSRVGQDSAFHIACFEGHKAIVDALLAAGADPNGADPRGFVPLELAASQNQASIIKALLAAGADLHRRNSKSGTALHTAAAEGSPRAIKALIDAGALCSDVDEHAATPLIYAAQNGQKAAATALLKAGADPSVSDRFGGTPMLHAARAGRKRRVESWRSEGTLFDRPVRYEITRGQLRFHDPPESDGTWLASKDQRLIAKRHCPQHFHYMECIDMAKTLLRAGADPAATDEDGTTPIHVLAACGAHALFGEAVRKLDGGIGSIGQTKSGRSVAHEAVSSRNMLFLDAYHFWSEVDFVAADESGRTPLHLAAETGDTKLTEWTRAKTWRSVVSIDREGRTPAEVAERAGFTELAQSLRASEAAQIAAAKTLPKGVLLTPDEVISKLTDEGGFLEDLPNSSSNREELEHAIVVVGTSWVDAWFDRESATLASSPAVAELSTLRTKLEQRARGGVVRVRVRPESDLPPKVRAAISALPAQAASTVTDLLDGTRWLKVMEGLAYRNDPNHGWHSVTFEGDEVVRFEGSDEEAIGSRFEEGTVEPVPAALASRLSVVLARAAQLSAQYHAGEIAWANPQYAELRYLNLAIDGRAHRARVNGRIVESSRDSSLDTKVLSRDACSAAIQGDKEIETIEPWLLAAVLGHQKPAPPPVPAKAVPAPRGVEIDVNLADRIDAVGTEALMQASGELKLRYKKWTWGDMARTHHGVGFEGASLLWFTRSASHHGPYGAANQTFDSFLRDGQANGNRPTAATLAEVVAALGAMVERAESAL